MRILGYLLRFLLAVAALDPWTLCAFEPVYHYQLEPVAPNIGVELSSATNFSQLVLLVFLFYFLLINPLV